MIFTMRDLCNEMDAAKVHRGGKEGFHSTQTDEGGREQPPAPVFRPELLRLWARFSKRRLLWHPNSLSASPSSKTIKELAYRRARLLN